MSYCSLSDVALTATYLTLGKEIRHNKERYPTCCRILCDSNVV